MTIRIGHVEIPLAPGGVSRTLWSDEVKEVLFLSHFGESVMGTILVAREGSFKRTGKLGETKYSVFGLPTCLVSLKTRTGNIVDAESDFRLLFPIPGLNNH